MGRKIVLVSVVKTLKSNTYSYKYGLFIGPINHILDEDEGNVDSKTTCLFLRQRETQGLR